MEYNDYSIAGLREDAQKYYLYAEQETDPLKKLEYLKKASEIREIIRDYELR
jgi:hypothetical protein